MLDMGSEALITLFLGFGAATISLLFWKLSRSQSTNRL
ncbi:putative membrane protein [Synechococcus sp. BIOS-E4-1]|nr:putative membrane protein [Synechococcus sp. BIOS-E4-1]